MKYAKSILGLLTVSLLFVGCQKSEIEDENNNITTETISEELTATDITNVTEAVSIHYPITVINDDEINETIDNDEDLEAYGKKVKKPRIKFPLEITVGEETITINSPKELKQLLTKRIHQKRRPPFKLVFPVTVINADESTSVIEDKEGLKKHKESLDEGERISFQFPISIEKKDGTIIEIESEDDLKNLMKRGHGKHTKNRPPFKLVFPVTVINTDESTSVIEDKEGLKEHKESLDEGEKISFQFPISVEQKDGSIVEIESEDDLKEHIKENSPRRKK